MVMRVVIFSRRASPIPGSSPRRFVRTSSVRSVAEVSRVRAPVEVGAAFKGVFALEFENRADFAKGGGDLILGHELKLSTKR